MKTTMEHRQSPATLAIRRLTPAAGSWLCLGCAVALLLVADGRATAALAIWPATALLLRFLRTQPLWRGLAAVYVLRIALVPIVMKGMIPIPVPFYYIYLVIAGLSGLIPYALDRWLAPRLSGFAATLVFPAALTLSQYMYGKGPTGSWGSIAYTQTGNLALEQLLAVTGLSGIVFLVGWFASSVNWAWENRSPRRLAAFAAVMGIALLGGELRMVLAPPSGPTVRVASLSRNEAIASGGSNEAVNADLLARAEREARAGARIIFWGEGNAQVLKQEEPQLIARGSTLARQYGVYLGMAMASTTPGAPKPLENKVVLIAPDGSVAWQYEKVRPTPGPEQAASVPNDGRLKTLDSPFGRLTTPICYDMDFPSLLKQAGAAHVDLALSPANDWREIDPRHTEIASYRAIEQGFNLVRQSSKGLSAAYDYQGHVLAVADAYSSGDGTLVAEVPTRGARTLYALFGDWLVWLSGAAFLTLLWIALRRRPSLESGLPRTGFAPGAPRTV